MLLLSNTLHTSNCYNFLLNILPLHHQFLLLSNGIFLYHLHYIQNFYCIYYTVLFAYFFAYPRCVNNNLMAAKLNSL